MKLSRSFIIVFLLILFLVNVNYFWDKMLFLISGLFLVIYFWKDLEVFLEKKKIIFLTICLSALFGALLFNKIMLPSSNQEHFYQKEPLKIIIIRDSVLLDTYNVSLGKIIEGPYKNEYVLIKSDIINIYKINQVVLSKKGVKANSQKSLPFDLLFFGKVGYEISFEKLTILGKKDTFNIFSKISLWRDDLNKKIKTIFSSKDYSLVSMWVFGKSKIIDYDLYNLFKKTGINHILVISGTHVSILFNVITFLIVLVPFSFSMIGFLLWVLMLLAFLLLTGFSASIFRAVVMWFFILLAKANGLAVNYTNIFLLVFLILAFLNPNVILYDVGFHLSILSVASLIYIMPIFWYYYENKINTVFNFNQKIKDLIGFFVKIFLASISIYVGIWAYLVFVFKEINYLGVFFNVFLIPIATLALLLVFVALMVSYVNILLGEVLGFLATLIISIFVKLTYFLSQFNFSGNISIFNFNYMVIFYYTVIFIWVVNFYKKHKELTFYI